jgi:hypothetical protein
VLLFDLHVDTGLLLVLHRGVGLSVAHHSPTVVAPLTRPTFNLCPDIQMPC